MFFFFVLLLLLAFALPSLACVLFHQRSVLHFFSPLSLFFSFFLLSSVRCTQTFFVASKPVFFCVGTRCQREPNTQQPATRHYGETEPESAPRSGGAIATGC